MASSSLQATAFSSLYSNPNVSKFNPNVAKASSSRAVKVSQTRKLGAQKSSILTKHADRFSVQCSVSTTEAPEVTIEDRKSAAEVSQEKKNFKISQVDAAAKQDFYSAEVLRVQDVAEGVRCITVDAEISREFIELSKAYKTPGQKVEVRVSGGNSVEVSVSSSPFPSETNHAVLLKLRGDIPAGSTKLALYGVSVKAPLDLHVTQTSSPSLYDLKTGDEVEIGPFQKGVDLRPILFLAKYPTVLIFARGEGIAPARALIEAEDVGSLFLNMREEVRVFYSSPSPSDVAYQHLFQSWEEERGVKVRPTVDSPAGGDWSGFVGSFQELFDDDDLEYDPDSTAAIVFGRKDENEDVMKLLEEAGLPEKSILRWDM